MMHLRIAPRARGDLVDIYRHSEKEFGEAAAARYHDLVIAAFRDIAADPKRAGARRRPDLPGSPSIYHLRLSRRRSETVTRPRHFVVFRIEKDIIEIVRVLHDAMDLAERLLES